MEKKRGQVRLSGLNGKWRMFQRCVTPYGATYYLWESEQHGDEYGAVLTDEYLTVIDYCCESDIITALFENGIIPVIDETEQEDKVMMDEMNDWLLLAGLEY